MFQFAFVGIAVGGTVGAPISFDGSFDKTAAPTTVTSDTRTATVPGGSSGFVNLLSFVTSGVLVSHEYQKNGGSWVTFVENDSIALANGDTLAFRINGASSGESLAFNLTDHSTSMLIETVNLVAS